MANNAETPPDRPALLLTRPRHGAEAFLKTLSGALLQDVEICLSPLLEIRGLGSSAQLPETAAAIFTSANAVPFAEAGRNRSAFCVGERTAAAATNAGWQVEVISETADALVAKLTALRPKAALVHVAGAHRRGQIAERLTQVGLTASVITVYEQALLPLTPKATALLEGSNRVIIPVFSPRTAAHLVQTTPSLARAHVFAISPAAAAAFEDVATAALHVAQAPTAEEMRRGVEMLLSGLSLP